MGFLLFLNFISEQIRHLISFLDINQKEQLIFDFTLNIYRGNEKISAFYATKEHLKYILPSECKLSIYQLKPMSLISHNNIQVFKHLFHFLVGL